LLPYSEKAGGLIGQVFCWFLPKNGKKLKDKKYTGLQTRLEKALKEVAYYKRLSKEAGDLRLRETEELSGLISKLKQAEKEREMLIFELKDALSQVKALSGLLPICASCKKIKNDKGHWEQMEIYIRNRSEVNFSHGICPECAEKLYPEYYKKK